MVCSGTQRVKCIHAMLWHIEMFPLLTHSLNRNEQLPGSFDLSTHLSLLHPLCLRTAMVYSIFRPTQLRGRKLGFAKVLRK